MNPIIQQMQQNTRRHFLQNSGIGLGSIALGSLLAGENQTAASPANSLLANKKPHFAAKAKRVIYLHMTGSPPNLDLFDYKPELIKRDSEDLPGRFP